MLIIIVLGVAAKSPLEKKLEKTNKVLNKEKEVLALEKETLAAEVLELQKKLKEKKVLSSFSHLIFD